MNTDPIVHAEVLIRKPPENSAEPILEKVRNSLTRMGLKVIATGSRSVSVQGTKEQFESIFNCTLVEPEQTVSRVMDFGPLGGKVLRPTEPLKIPAELNDEVESVVIQEPALMF